MDSDNQFTLSELLNLTGVNGKGHYVDDYFSEAETNTESTEAEYDSSTSVASNVALESENVIAEVQEEIHGNLGNRRKRLKRPNPQIWKANQAKLIRMQGKRCIVKNKDTGRNEVSERYLGPKCNSKFCAKSTLRHCEEFSETTRKEIFSTFWNDFNWKEKIMYVKSLVDKTNCKRGYPTKRAEHNNTQRANSLFYYLKLNQEKKQVCKKLFLSTLGLKGKQVLRWMNKNAETIISPIINSSTLIQTAFQKEFLKNFLTIIPKMPSHYCRKNTMKLFLEPVIQSKTQLYTLYKEKCGTEKHDAMSRRTFDRMFEKMNLSLYLRRKDQCDICVSFEKKNISKEVYDKHIEKKERARKSKSEDKLQAALEKFHVVTMDVESVKISPSLNASSLYYRSKLINHNFTVYDLTTKQCKCYWWNETDGDLCASTFASCVVDFLKRYNDDLPIVIYSDGCTSQNRNAMMSNALLMFAITHNKIIIQKYLEKGHTQMECDSVHSTIETKLHNKEIYVPSDYVEVCNSARQSPFPYETMECSYTFFVNYAEIEKQIYKSIRPGNAVGDPVVTDIRGLKYTPSGCIQYKLTYDEPWKKLPRKAKSLIVHEFSPLYDQRLAITEKKYIDLQELKKVIPSIHHEFYDRIPYKA